MSQMRFVVWLLVSAKSKTSSPCGLGLNLMKLFWYFSSPFKIISFILPRSIISVQNMLVCPKMVYESIYLMKLLFVVCLLCCMFLIGFMNLSDEITTFFLLFIQIGLSISLMKLLLLLLFVIVNLDGYWEEVEGDT